MQKNIAVVGALNLDFITEYRPKDKGDIRSWGRDEERCVDDSTWWHLFYRYLPGRTHWVNPGGSAANTGAALAAIDPQLSVQVIGVLGEDPEAYFLSAREQWFGAKLNTVSVPGMRTGKAFSYLEPGEGRRIAVSPGCNARFVKSLVEEMSSSVEWLHASSFADENSNSELAEFLRIVRARYPNITISADLGRFLTKEGLTDIAINVLRQCDILFTKTSELKCLSGVSDIGSEEGIRLSAVDRLREASVDHLSVVVERIPNGYTLYKPNEVSSRFEFEAGPIEDVVDDTGAGDVFNAGFIYGYMRGLDSKNTTRLIRSAVQTHLRSHGRDGFSEFCKATPILFASHSAKDKKYVKDFINQFEGTEISFWLDEDEIPFGVRLQEAILAGIRNSDFLAVFITPDSMSSGWVEKEIQWAKEHKLPIVAIRLANVAVPETVSEYLFIDVVRLGFLAAREGLLNALNRGIMQ